MSATPSERQRVCFLLRVRPDRLAEYRARHAEVWPEMTAALRRAGWTNYSIFADESGVVVGYLECDDFAAASAAMARSEVNRRWQAEMAPYFEGLGGVGPDEAIRPLPELFHLP
jgi:L-rhamnose mutarotase